ncbi:MAG: hypothetical protein ACFBRM_09760 [Pikeienuella sp.]
MSVLYNFGGAGGGDYIDQRTVLEVTASGLSEDAGQVLVEGSDGGALLTGTGIQAALDAALGGPEWREAEAERLLSYDAATRSLGILAGTGVVLPLASEAAPGLMSAADKQALAAVAGGAGGVASELTRTGVAGAAIEPGVASLRTSGYAVAGDGGGGLYARVASEPDHAGKVQSADGAWWALIPEMGRVNVLQFGAARTTDGSLSLTDAGAAFAAAIGFAARWTAGTDAAGLTLVVPPGRYLIGQTLEIRAGLRLLGQPGAAAGGAGAVRLDFTDTAGLVLHGARSIGVDGAPEDPDDPATAGATGAVLEGLFLSGAAAGAGFDPLKPGLRVHARCVLRDLRVEGFSGHGVHIEADASGGDAAGWAIDGLRAVANGGSGLYVAGLSAGGGIAQRLSLVGNGRWGLEEASGAGGRYIGLDASGNGTAAAGQDTATAFVAETGALFCAAVGASAAALVATRPGTDAAVWEPCLSGVVPNPQAAPDWVAGQPVGTYRTGGALLVEGAANASLIAGATLSEDQPPAALGPLGVLVGGVPGVPRAALAGAGMALASGEGSIDWQVGGTVAQSVTLAGGTAAFGRPAPIGEGRSVLPAGAFLGDATEGRQLVFAADAQPAQDHGPGDLVFANAPAVGAPVGWLWLTSHDADGAAGLARALWPVPSLDGAVTLPTLTALALQAEPAANHPGTLVFEPGRAAPMVSDGFMWRDLRAQRVLEKTTDATLTLEDAGAILRFTGTAAQVLTIPAGLFTPGDQVTLVQSGTGSVTVAAGSGVAVDSADGAALGGQHAAAALVCLATDSYLLIGRLADT